MRRRRVRSRLSWLVEPILIGIGAIVVEIIRCVLSADHDLVVIPDAAEGYRSTTLRLLRERPVPVRVMTPEHSIPRRILAAPEHRVARCSIVFISRIRLIAALLA